MIVKIFSDFNIKTLNDEIQAWFDNLEDNKVSFDVVSVSQSYDTEDGRILITIIINVKD